MSTCRICSCTDEDCSWCIVLTGKPCFWQEPDLCSSCFILDGLNDWQRARLLADECFIRARKRWGRVPGGPELDAHGKRFLRVCARIDAAERRASA